MQWFLEIFRLSYMWTKNINFAIFLKRVVFWVGLLLEAAVPGNDGQPEQEEKGLWETQGIV